MDKPPTYIKTGCTWKFRPQKLKWIRHQNYHIEKVNDKTEAFNKNLSTGKIEDKIDYSYKRGISKQQVCKTHRNGW